MLFIFALFAPWRSAQARPKATNSTHRRTSAASTVPSMRCAWIAGCVVALALSIGVQTAMAEAEAVQRTDPQAESPAGVIYQIPLDSARRDAAPVLPSGRRNGGSSGGGAGGSSGSGGGAGGSGGGSAGQSGSSGGGGTNGGGTGGSSGGGNTSGSAGGSSGGAHGGGVQSASVAEGGGTPRTPPRSTPKMVSAPPRRCPGSARPRCAPARESPPTTTAGSTLPPYLLIVLIAAPRGHGCARHARLPAPWRGTSRGL